MRRLIAADSSTMKALSDIGLVGLAVMGENLILNMESKGYTVTAYNRSTDKVDDFISGRATGKNIRGVKSVEALVASLESPRKVMLMVKAGEPVDDFIEQLSRTSSRAISSSTVVTRILATASAEPATWRARACCLSAPVSPAARKAH